MTDAFALTEDQELFRREWRRLFEEKFTERAAEIDRTGEFPWDNLKVLAEAGLTGINVPEAYGRAGADSITHCILVEEVARVYASTSLIPSVNKLATCRCCSPAPRSRSSAGCPDRRRLGHGLLLPDRARFGVGRGRDALTGGPRRRRLRHQRHQAVHHRRRGRQALHLLHRHRPRRRVQGHQRLHPRGHTMPGFEIGKHEDKLGIRGSPTARVICNDVRVPAANRLGEENQGFPLALRALDHNRVTIGAQAVGIAQGAFDYALRLHPGTRAVRPGHRRLPGHPVHAGRPGHADRGRRALVYQAAAQAGRDDPTLTLSAAAAGSTSPPTPPAVTTDAVQLLGGYGYIKDFPLERMLKGQQNNANI